MKITVFGKRRRIILFCVLFFFCCLMPAVLSHAEGENGEVLTVGVPVDRCPVFYEDEERGEIVGIGVDLMRTAAENAGYKTVFKSIGDKTLREALDDPAFDVVMPFGSALPSAAGKETIVSDNLMQTPFTLLTNGRRGIPKLNELKVGMLSSLSSGAETVRQLYPGMEIVFYDTMDEAVKALRSDKVDALLHNSYVWSYVLQKPSYGDLEVKPSAMFSMDFRAGTQDTPEGRVIIDRLNGGIASLSDTYQEAVVLDYTTRKLYRLTLYDRIYELRWSIVLVGLLLVAVILIAVFRGRALRLEQEKEVLWLEDHDSLTGALSLAGFRKKVEELLRSHPDIPYLLAYVNIKNFKFVNDSLGMKAGDELLRYWVKRTQQTLSEEEAVCRIESDHVAVLRHAGGEEKLHRDDQEVIDSVREFFLDLGKENRVQICGGIYVLTPKDYQRIDVDHMLDCARIAEKKVREAKVDGYDFYNPEEWERGKRVADVVGRLPVALRSGEIQIWYQPQVDYITGKITGLEALSRWNHSTLGWIPPGEFIPELEETGLIYDLDSYVWEHVCRDLKQWKEQGIHRSVSVNLSRSDIREDRDIPGHFHDLIKSYGLSPDQFRIEITETAFAKDPELLIHTTEELRKLGFQVEMDDFGSGYSSLHMLKEVPVDRIKLDLHFLTETGDVNKGQIIVGYMIQMVRSLGMSMIVEGVETKEQAEFLKERGCSEMQGFYFHKPMSKEDLEQLPAEDFQN